MGLFFLVLFAVGILRPIRNALALDGLAESEFYKVYFVSAVVILIAPALTHLSDRIPWRTLIPATAAFFALNLLAFRVFYSEGSGTLGMVFYGWYDLFAAALVTQFFMAVQVFFNVRDAKSAIPIVIAAGSLGATLGSVTTGFLARIIGTPNLILVAALFVGMFAATLPFVWTADSPLRPPGRRVRTGESGGFSTGNFARVFSNRHIRMIAGLVLVTVLVKTLVDYEFNEAVAAYAGDRDAISSFQGYVFGAINWLPIAILLPLGPLIKRWGVGLVVLMLPLVMLGFTAALAVGFSVWMATLAKAADATFRYSAERTGREVLYVPVPTELKLKAKAYVDMAVEKGVGKGVSGLLIFLLLAFVGDYQRIAWAALALSVAWCFMALSAKRRYVTALAESMRGRFANLESGFATLTERSTLAMVEAALRGNTVEIGFGLDLVEQAGSVDATHLADELELLLAHPDEAVRIRVLRLLARFPGLVAEPRIRARLDDSSEPVREAAVGALVATRTDGAGTEALLRELLESTEGAVRLATVSSLLNGTVDRELVRRLGSEHLDARFPGAKSEEGLTATLEGGGSASRRELALTAGLFHRGTFACLIISELLDDDDPVVAGAAIRSAGLVDSAELRGQLISLLAETPLRGSVREALLLADSGTAELCGAKLKDREEKAVIRRH